MNVKLITLTPDAEKTMAYIARVSSPNQENPEYAKLLRYCLENGHFSVFEHAHATMEIVTSRAISAQIIRHKSFAFSEFSTRYSEVASAEFYEARRQDVKNRQNSLDDLPEETKDWWEGIQKGRWEEAHTLYEKALRKGIAKECARMILPLQTQTRLYMTGSIRSWIHYLQVRNHPHTQLEHREIAVAIQEILAAELPVVAEAAGWV